MSPGEIEYLRDAIHDNPPDDDSLDNLREALARVWEEGLLVGVNLEITDDGGEYPNPYR